MAEYPPEQNNIIEAQKKYTGLLTKTAEMSESLMDAVGRDDMSEASRVLRARQELCAQIEHSISTLGQLIKNTNDSTALGSIKTETEALETAVLEKQSQSEQMLSEKLSEYKSALTDLRHRRNVNSTYNNIHRERVPAFLDSKS